MDKNPRFSIIFITANRCEELLGAVRSVWKLPGEDLYEIIVVDNGSEDETSARITQQYPDIRLVRLEANQGVAQGRNIGAQAARGEFLIFIDDDAVLTPRGCWRY